MDLPVLFSDRLDSFLKGCVLQAAEGSVLSQLQRGDIQELITSGCVGIKSANGLAVATKPATKVQPPQVVCLQLPGEEMEEEKGLELECVEVCSGLGIFGTIIS